MSSLDLVLLSVLFLTIVGFARLGLVKAVSTAIGMGLAFFVLVPLLTGPIVSLFTEAISLFTGGGGGGDGGPGLSKGSLHGLVVALLVLLGAGLGNLVGFIVTVPVEIIPGVNLLNSLGGAGVGVIAGLVAVGVVFVVLGLVVPEWTRPQLSQSSLFSTFFAQNIGHLALLFAPAEMGAFLEKLKSVS